MTSNNTQSDSEADSEHSSKEENSKIKLKQIKNHGEERDTSHFTIEERLVAAVWVHERKTEKLSISQIKINFKLRFGKPPPTKNTLYYWEKKIFSTGKVMDAKRSGRPCRRKAHIGIVEASLRQSPGLSLRARAQQLHLPRTTLKKILQEDLRLNIDNIRLQSNISVIDNHSEVAKSPNLSTHKQNVNQSSTTISATNLPPPSTYSYPETLGSLPLTAFPHYLSYSNNNSNQTSITNSNHSKISNETQNTLTGVPHIINQQQHSISNNQHNFLSINPNLEKPHINYIHNNEHSRNQISHVFHS